MGKIGDNNGFKSNNDAFHPTYTKYDQNSMTKLLRDTWRQKSKIRIIIPNLIYQLYLSNKSYQFLFTNR